MSCPAVLPHLSHTSHTPLTSLLASCGSCTPHLVDTRGDSSPTTKDLSLPARRSGAPWSLNNVMANARNMNPMNLLIMMNMLSGLFS